MHPEVMLRQIGTEWSAMSVLLDPQKQTRGELVIEVLPEWAPLAAARFKELVEVGFYKRTGFHRVLQGFLPGDLSVAQFGISTRSRELNTEWSGFANKRLAYCHTAGGALALSQ